VNPKADPDDPNELAEWVAIVFDLIGGSSVSEVVEGLEDGILRIGVHVIAFPDGSSEAAVTTPEPATLGLMLMGSLMLLGRRSKQG
jgi:hypothetical protein